MHSKNILILISILIVAGCMGEDNSSSSDSVSSSSDSVSSSSSSVSSSSNSVSSSSNSVSSSSNSVSSSSNSVSSSSSSGKLPNIVLIMADDLGFEALESYGGRSYETPNLTRLGQEGIQFNQAYATPLCTNTRNQLMTGRYQNRNWIGFGLLNPEEKTFGHLMQEAGYNTAIAGKWQLQSYDSPDYPGADLRRGIGMRVEDAGFDEYSLFHDVDTEVKGNRYHNPRINQNGVYLPNMIGKYGPDVWYEFIADYMTRKKDDDKPFFIYYPMALPHSPFKPTPNSADWADPDKRDQFRRHYFTDMVEYLDFNVGKIVDKIDDLDIREDTIIIFYSDNGSPNNFSSNLNGELVEGGKSKVTDIGTRVPMYVSWKGKTPQGEISDNLIDSTDFLPTLLHIAGRPELAEHQQTDGKSFLPQIKGEPGATRDWVYMHFEARPGERKDNFTLSRFARDTQYKLYQDGRMYTPATDIDEERPLMPENDTAAMKNIREKLQIVLDSMKPYQLFNPDEVPRPNTPANNRRFMFNESVGCLAMEAESVNIPRDESWLLQDKIPGFAGTGYLRALRDQPDSPEKGKIRFRVNIEEAGVMNFDIRHRHDHYDLGKENGFWIKINGGPWKAYRSANNRNIRGWEFGIAERNTASTTISIELTAGNQNIRIAPMYDNFKLDRVVAYRINREACTRN